MSWHTVYVQNEAYLSLSRYMLQFELFIWQKCLIQIFFKEKVQVKTDKNHFHFQNIQANFYWEKYKNFWRNVGMMH